MQAGYEEPRCALPADENTGAGKEASDRALAAARHMRLAVAEGEWAGDQAKKEGLADAWKACKTRRRSDDRNPGSARTCGTSSITQLRRVRRTSTHVGRAQARTTRGATAQTLTGCWGGLSGHTGRAVGAFGLHPCADHGRQSWFKRGQIGQGCLGGDRSLGIPRVRGYVVVVPASCSQTWEVDTK